MKFIGAICALAADYFITPVLINSCGCSARSVEPVDVRWRKVPLSIWYEMWGFLYDNLDLYVFLFVKCLRGPRGSSMVRGSVIDKAERICEDSPGYDNRQQPFEGKLILFTVVACVLPVERILIFVNNGY